MYTQVFPYHFSVSCLLTSCPCNFSLYIFVDSEGLMED